ncbi:MAG: hypothetical protein ACKPKO_63980, partial [Candidatus Fonsibacter sp.]
MTIRQNAATETIRIEEDRRRETERVRAQYGDEDHMSRLEASHWSVDVKGDLPTETQESVSV